MTSPFGGGFPDKTVTAYETIGTSTSTTRGTTLTAGSAHVKGSWVQLVASTARKSVFMIIIPSRKSASADYFVDIGTGGAGSETTVLADIYDAAGAALGEFTKPLSVFLKIDAGIRVAARTQSTTSTATIEITALLGGSPG